MGLQNGCTESHPPCKDRKSLFYVQQGAHILAPKCCFLLEKFLIDNIPVLRWFVLNISRYSSPLYPSMSRSETKNVMLGPPIYMWKFRGILQEFQWVCDWTYYMREDIFKTETSQHHTTHQGLFSHPHNTNMILAWNWNM